MQEKQGVAHCASTFASDGCPPTTVYAAPVFVPVTMNTDDLPLQELYDHPDLVDIISAQEFGLEQTAHDRLLLCVVVSAAESSLRELEELIAPIGALTPCVACIEEDGMLTVRTEGRQFRVPAEENTGAFLATMQAQALPLPAVLAALTTWCTGYGCTLCWEAAQ